MEIEEAPFFPAAAIFDMDGLMFDTEEPFIRLWPQIGKKFGYSITRDIVLRMVGINGESARAVMKQEYGADFPYDKMREELRILFKKEFENAVPHKKGLVYLLDRLCAAGISLGVATSTRRATAIEMLDKAGVLERFTAVTGGDEIKNGKPAPDIFLIAAEKLGQPPGSCVGFEDSTAGLIGLYTAGIKSIFIKDIVEPPQEVLASVWRRCNDLSEAVSLFGL
jgi:HAD superfamily hydrolase (TIGR01509 family)